ncbi:MAG: efflux RND transporter permease subunit, partial [Haliea sp.]
DAIVVLENIHRHHDGENIDPEEAAIRGTNEVMMAVIAASLTLLCIFGTVVFTEGMIGVFFRSFAVVVSVGVAVSLLVSLTLTPALCARFLIEYKPPSNKLLRWLQQGHLWSEHFYRRLLEYSLQIRGLIMLLSLLTVASCGWFMTQLGAEFLPEDDESRYRILLKAPLGASIDYTTRKLDEAEHIVSQYPEVLHILSSIGSSRGSGVNEAILHIELLPKHEREASQRDVMALTREQLDTIAGVESYISPAPVMEQINADSFEAVITGPDLRVLATLAQQVHSELVKYEGMGNVRLGLNLSRPQLTFNIDRDRARALGLTARQIGDTVRVLVGGADIAKYNNRLGDGDRHDIQLAAQRSGMREARDLKNVYLNSPEGQLIALGAVVNIEETIGPAVIERTDLQYSARFTSSPGIPQNEAIQLFVDTARAILPLGYQYKLAGQADEILKTTDALLFIFITGLLLVYMVLASQFNSFLQPALIMLAQPLAIFGGLVALWLTGSTLNIFSMTGLVLLVGLVSKNSTLLVDLINRLRDAGKETDEAILLACPRRMRPVLMTSLTIVLAMLPAAVGVGAGAGLYGPLAVAVIGGIVSSTLLTLIVVPVAYSLLDRWLTVEKTAPGRDHAPAQL